MSINKLSSLFLILFLIGGFSADAQLSGNNRAKAEETTDTEEESDDSANQTTDEEEPPIDDIVKKRLVEERFTLPYEPVREADILWEKRIWRVIDTREKINKYFTYPEAPFVKVLMDAAINGEINVYSTVNDKFTQKMTSEEVGSIGASVDTILKFDPETYEEKIEVVRNEMDYNDIKRFRLKEVWFFDEESSTMKVRILGIAPLKDVKDENGNYKYEQPLFWAYYPDCRELLANYKVYNPENDASPLTWEDMFEMRFFSSYIFKESNVYDRRLKDYLTGVDILLQSDKIKAEIFNFEQDVWSY